MEDLLSGVFLVKLTRARWSCHCHVQVCALFRGEKNQASLSLILTVPGLKVSLGLKFREPGGGRKGFHQHTGREAEFKGEIYLKQFLNET